MSRTESGQNNSHWSHAEVKFLLSLWRQDELLKQTKTAKTSRKSRSKKVFEEWSDTMAASGLNRAGPQIENKLQAFSKAYKKVIEHNNKSGNNRITCDYFDEIHKFMKDRPSMNPTRGSVIESISSPPPPPPTTASRSRRSDAATAGGPDIERPARASSASTSASG